MQISRDSRRRAAESPGPRFHERRRTLKFHRAVADLLDEVVDVVLGHLSDCYAKVIDRVA